MEKIIKRLQEHKDEEFAKFHKKLIPGMDESDIIGVRTPVLRKMAKEIAKEDICNAFLEELPHQYHEENQLHGFIISGMKDFELCLEKLENFLPYINNWATCDQTSPKVFKKKKKELMPYIKKWLKDEHVYTKRFAIGMLMQHYLDEDFKEEYLEWVSGIESEEYYVNMEIAWYMATALAKQWDATVPYIEKQKMNAWVHNKTIQKARESYRITKEQKEYLVQFKINAPRGCGGTKLSISSG